MINYYIASHKHNFVEQRCGLHTMYESLIKIMIYTHGNEMFQLVDGGNDRE